MSGFQCLETLLETHSSLYAFYSVIHNNLQVEPARLDVWASDGLLNSMDLLDVCRRGLVTLPVHYYPFHGEFTFEQVKEMVQCGYVTAISTKQFHELFNEWDWFDEYLQWFADGHISPKPNDDELKAVDMSFNQIVRMGRLDHICLPVSVVTLVRKFGASFQQAMAVCTEPWVEGRPDVNHLLELFVAPEELIHYWREGLVAGLVDNWHRDLILSRDIATFEECGLFQNEWDPTSLVEDNLTNVPLGSFDCPICYDTKPTKVNFCTRAKADTADHSLCPDCMIRLIKTHCDDGCMDIPCPICRALLNVKY